MFYGALVHNKFDSGIFITSSRFRSGAIEAASDFKKHAGVKIDLVDGQKLLDYISILSSEMPVISLNSCPHWRTKSPWLG
jgi:restriction endonuclease Mrr